MGCWAEPLGDCRGRTTGEHIISGSIFTGRTLGVDGAPWFKGESKQIPLAAAVANILCEGHNHRLGEYADPAAKQLRAALQGSVRNKLVNPGNPVPLVLTRGGILVHKPIERLSGPDFGAWLCKTHCNVMAAAGNTPALAYVRYAFERRDPGIGFYFPHVVNETVSFTDNPHVTYVNFDEPGEPFAIQICGHWTLVALQPVLKGEFVNRVAELRFASITLMLDWRNDPPPTDAQDAEVQTGTI